MSAILNSLHAHNFLIFRPILMVLVSEFVVYRALSDRHTYFRVAVTFNLNRVSDIVQVKK